MKQRQNWFRSDTPVCAFSLLELLASMSVLLIISVLLSQLLNSVSTVSGQMTRTMEAFSGARFALDRMAQDLSGRGALAATPANIRTQPGNDMIDFWTLSPRASAERDLAAVQYRVHERRLERAVVPQLFSVPTTNAAPPAGNMLPFSGFPFANIGAGEYAEADYGSIADVVFRMEVCYVLNDGSVVQGGVTWADPTVAGVLVTLAALDSHNRGLLTDAQIDDMAAALPDHVDGGPDPASVWRPLVESGLASGAGLPVRPATSARVLQRIFPRHEL